MASSNTYTFGSNTDIDDLMVEVFERLGITGNDFTGLQTQSFIMSANLELTSWQGKVPLSWTLKRFMESVYVGQPTYFLPTTITRVVDVVATQPTRISLPGTAFTTEGGNAANCFDPAATAGCIQTAPNGAIGFDYGPGTFVPVQYVGIEALIPDVEWNIIVENSRDPTDEDSWYTVYEPDLEVYNVGRIIWFVIPGGTARAWRIRETKGGTLGVKQIYFSQPTNTGTGDRTLMPLSYTEWMQIPTKNNQGFPSSYFFNAQIEPTLTLWPIVGPSMLQSQFTALLYTAYQYSQDVTFLFNQFDVPQRFYDALVAGCAARMARKFAPDRVADLKIEASEAFKLAALTDFQSVTMRFQPDFSQYG